MEHGLTIGELIENFVGDLAVGIVSRVNNAIEKVPESLENLRHKSDELLKELDAAKTEVQAPFSFEEELKTKEKRLAKLNAIFEGKSDDGLAHGSENTNANERAKGFECVL